MLPPFTPAVKLYLAIAGLSGCSAVALGAYGSHGFHPQNAHFATVFDTANKYQLLHSVVLLTAPLWRRTHLTGVLMSTGVLLFSGSCYAAALYEDRSMSRPAPYGGMLLMLGWLSLALP